ncbi:MAG: hypothetical protein QOK37_2387 [Thermoanaerobaculia bacterium]|nr:hypothetical protein [Thermoanaerobaculia bacterium]
MIEHRHRERKASMRATIRAMKSALHQIVVTLLFLATPAAFAQSLDDAVASVMKEYGGAAAWQKVTTIRESGKVVPAMRKGDGAMTRFWQKPDKLRVEIVYPERTELRVVDGDHGTNNGKDVAGPGLDAMKLQAARMALPLLLAGKTTSLHDLGVRDGFRAIEISLSSSLTVTIDIDPKTSHIVRSTGKTTGMDFVVDYGDFRRVDGLLFAFSESGTAQGMPTAKTTIDSIVINGPATPAAPPAK